jgi:hypothetical protein
MNAGPDMTVVRDASRARLVQNRLLPAATFMILVIFAALFAVSVPLYTRVLGSWSFVMTDRPFIDTEYVTAQIACWGRGIDVYRVNPCDPLGRLHDYSPLWLRMGFLPAGPAWAKILGLWQDLLFAGALGFLPAVPGRAATALTIAAIASPTVLFALERGNVDVGMVVLAILALALWERRGAAHAAGYGVVLLAGLLKFYPLVLFVRAWRESWRYFLTVAAVAALVVAGFAAWYQAELRSALANVPAPSDFGDGFSSHQLGNGIAVILGHRRAGLALTVIVDLIAVGLSVRLATRRGFAAACGTLNAREAACLVAGALLFCGCFASGPSVGYRAVVLILALPGCIAMAQRARGRAKRLLWGTAISMVLAMWNFVPMMALGPKAALGRALGGLPFLGVWVAREGLWWVVFIVLLAVVLQQMFQKPGGIRVSPRLPARFRPRGDAAS